MIVKKVEAGASCAVCHRTLLLGEQAFRYTPGDGEWVDVCQLCIEQADEHGWIREGSPRTPLVAESGRRRRRFGLGAIFDHRRAQQPSPLEEPVLRRLSQPEQAMLQAAEHFNASPFRRTVAGITKSLGEPRASLLPLSGTNPEVVITIAWDISWYQYRVVLGSGQPVRLAERGYELAELHERFQRWNASLDGKGRLVPEIPRL